MDESPTFFIVGAARCGTTYLCKALAHHPDVYMCDMKEPHYFAFMEQRPDLKGPHDGELNRRSIVWRRSEYDSLFSGRTEESAVGECSNSYLYYKEVPNRIRKILPGARIVAILRNPVDRTYSNYCQAVALGHEDLSFTDALAAEGERERMGWRWTYQYRGQSLYADAVERYYDTFGREQVGVFLYESLRGDSAAFLDAVCAHLGVSGGIEVGADLNRNPSVLPRSRWFQRLLTREVPLRRLFRDATPRSLRKALYAIFAGVNKGQRYGPPLDPATRDELRDYFRDDVQRLESLLQVDLSRWLRSGDHAQ